MQRDRRHDPYPLTWEVPLLVLLMVVLGLSLGVQVGRGLANLFVGAGWTWPDSARLLSSLPRVIGGDSAAGLAHPPGGLAGAGTVQIWIVLVEVVFLVGGGWTGVESLRRWGPWRVAGMASGAEAERLLGVRRLRRARTVVRPDLYGRASR